MKTLKKEKLTRGTTKLIKEARERVPEADKNNVYAITEAICYGLEEKHQKDGNVSGGLEYQLNRMGMSTTGAIVAKVTNYFLATADNKKSR